MEERTKGSGRASKTSNDSKTAGEHKTNAGMYSSGVAHQPMVERLARCLCESHTPASTSGCRANAAAAAAAMDGTRRRQRRTWRPRGRGRCYGAPPESTGKPRWSGWSSRCRRRTGPTGDERPSRRRRSRATQPRGGDMPTRTRVCEHRPDVESWSVQAKKKEENLKKV